MKLLDSSRVRVGVASFILVIALAGEFPRNLLTWWGWGVFAAVVVALGIALLVHARRSITASTIPIPLVAFLGLAVLSIAWSHYPGASALGVGLTIATSLAAAGIALALGWEELLRSLGWALRIILGLSLLFEFIVSAFIRQPIYPVWVVPGDYVNPDAKLLLWSRNLLFDGGKIQGVVGNSSLLAMLALLGVIVFAIQLASKRVTPVRGSLWLALALGLLLLTRSATIFAALGAVVIVTLAVIAVRRSATMRRGGLVRLGVLVAAIGAVVAAIALRGPLLGLLGKSSDFTGRFDIWAAVGALAEQRPVAGWGWVGYWAPWADPFDTLIVKGGVQVLHAHNAWIDVWFQLGAIGVVVFAALVLSTTVRSWLFAVDRTILIPGERGTHDWLGLLPVLIVTAQLVQSIAESRLLIEGGLLLFLIVAIATKRSNQVGSTGNA